MSGIDLIAEERKRQMEKEGWTPDHDDEHDLGELAIAAACYAVNKLEDRPICVLKGKPQPNSPVDAMPWGSCDDKREKHDRKRSLIIAGALIAAEIDRLERRGE